MLANVVLRRGNWGGGWRGYNQSGDEAPLISPAQASADQRQDVIATGLFLAKFDKAGLTRLGFKSFTEAFNVFGSALGVPPASIKNYRDEFDPFFPNPRRGWHKRELRHHCKDVLDLYRHADLAAFSIRVQSFFDHESDTERADEEDSQFAKRLETGLAAERYFVTKQPTLPEFHGWTPENTTQLGCGYDFRLHRNSHDFLAVEVKGLREPHGSVAMTAKEYHTARRLANRYFLFVVKDFRGTPNHEIFQDPASGRPAFRRTERMVAEVTWNTTV